MKVIPLYPKLFLSLTFFSLLLLLLDNFGWLNFPKMLTQQVTIPIQFGLYQSGRFWQKQLEFIFVARQVYLENKALKNQLATILAENATLQKSLGETQILVDQYAKLNPQTFDLLPSRVLGAERFLVIDKGSDQGVSLGQAVVFQENLIGEVKKVNPNMAWVQLISDPDSKIAVFSQGKEGNARGILQGQFGSEILMDKILHQENIEVGDLVYSEGTEGRLPKGLVFGRVSEVLKRENEVFKQAKVETIFKPEDLTIVFVMRGG